MVFNLRIEESRNNMLRKRERKTVFTGAVMLGTRREWTVQFSRGALPLPGLSLSGPSSTFYFHCAALYLIADNCTVLWFYASFLFNKAPHKSSFLLVSTPSTHIILSLTLTHNSILC